MYRLLAILACCGAAMAQTPPPHSVFDQDTVHEIRLRFDNADWFQVLTDNYDGVRAENPYFPASIEWGPYKFDNIGVRFKGNSSYNSSRTQKKPFRIKLNEFVKGQKIEGLASFGLSNGWNDPSYVREKPYYELAAKLGMKAPRSSYAALYINDEYWGLYILGEVVNGDFLTNYFGKNEDKGNLYKGNIGATFAYLGEDKQAYKNVWEKQSNEDADDWSDLIALTKLIDDTPAADLAAKLDPIMDIDSVLTALALDNATVNLDSYAGMGQNFNIYRRPSDNKWVWIPWDPSLAFGALSQGQTQQGMIELPLEWSNTGGGFGGGGFPPGGLPPGGLPPGGLPPGGLPPGGGQGGQNIPAGRPLATKLWENPQYRERYRQIYQQLMERVFRPEEVLARMNALRDMIRPWVQQETKALATFEQFEAAMTTPITNTPVTPGGGQPGQPGQPGQGGGQGGPGGGSAPGLQPFIEGRTAWVNTKLAESSVPALALSADTSGIALELNGSTANKQTVALTISGNAVPASYSLRAVTDNGGEWLVLNVSGGSIPGSFVVSPSASSLSAGTYTATIYVYSQGAANSPLAIPVTLTRK
ncbi:MAG: CotH kinase family protein [Bryobacterales bacterium]|nr:CotH kinase family protein [Bryobacterales bacterium]